MEKYTWLNTAEDLEKIYDTLDFSVIINRTINYLSTKINSENLLWVQIDEFKSIQKEKAIYKSSDLYSPDVLLSAQSYVTDQDVIKLLGRFKPPLTKPPAKVKEDLQWIDHKDGKWSCLVPIRSLDNLKPEGLLVFFRFESTERLNFNEKIVNIVAMMSRHVYFSLEHYRIKCQSFIDDVTQLYNQRYLSLVLDKEIYRAKRHKTSFTAMFVDVDYFKMVNDTRGHLVGSKILTEVSLLIKNQIRANDYAFRYGGDEFVILLIDTGVKAAETVAERIRKSVEDAAFAVEGPELRITVSIGLAAFPDHAKTSEQVIHLADQAMYYAKNKSRNIVYVTAS